MKKEWFKKLFVALFAIMLYTVCSMSTNALAASKITLKDGNEVPETIYVGRTLILKVAKTPVKFYSRDKSIATIELTTGTLRAKAPGKVEIIARSEANGKIIAKVSIEVNQRSTSLKVEEKNLLLFKDESATIKASILPATSTDVLRFVSSDEKVAAVDLESGKVTGKANGTATISVYAVDKKDIDGPYKEDRMVKVTVQVNDYIKQVKQVEVNKLEVSFDQDISNQKMLASDFVIKGKKNQDNYAIQKLDIDKENNKVYLTIFSKLIDGGEYSVIYKKREVKFQASNGIATKVELTPTTITCDDEIPLYVNFYDANGILLENRQLIMPQDRTSDYEIDVHIVGGYNAERYLWLNDKDSYAIINVKFHTNKYVNGTEIGDLQTGDVKITGISKDDAVAKGLTYTITDDEKRPYFQDKDYEQNKILAVGDTGYYIYFFIANCQGEEYVKYDEYEVKSSDINVLKIEKEPECIDHRYKITPMRAGTANLVITSKQTKKEVVTIPITVQPERVASTISIEKSKFVASISKEKNKSETFTIDVLDQYGQKMKQKNGFFISQIKVSDVSNVKDGCSMEKCISVANNVVTIYTADSPQETYTYKITYKNLTPVYFDITYKNR